MLSSEEFLSGFRKTDKIIEKTNHRKIDPDAAFFLKEAAKLELEFERTEEGIDMCESLERRYKKERIEQAIEIYREYGDKDEDIIDKIIKKFNVTKDYVLTLLAPKVIR